MKTNYTKEQKKEYYKGLEKECKEMFENFFKTANLKDLIKIELKTQATGYSRKNTILCILQARKQGLNYQGIVNAFYKWRKIKFKDSEGNEIATSINKGCKGLMIWRPQVYYYNDDINGKGNKVFYPWKQGKELYEQGKCEKDITFKIEKVFDISQTNNPDYIELREKEQSIIYGDGITASWEEVLKIVQNNFNGEILIQFDSSKMNGWYSHTDNKITVNNNDVGTLLHEYSHSITHHLKGVLEKELKVKQESIYAINEIIAEITSFELYKRLGHDLTKFNYNYSNCWSNALPDGMSYKVFKRVYTEILKAVDKVEIKNVVQVAA